jgi:hypothetical protein
MVGHSKQTGAVASNEYAVPLSSTTGKCSCEVFEEIKMRMPSTQGNKGMVVCAYEYSDGICGISEAAHARHGVARTGHTFTGAEIVRSMDAEIGDDGVARFVRLIKKGQYFVVPIEVLQAVIHAED